MAAFVQQIEPLIGFLDGGMLPAGAHQGTKVPLSVAPAVGVEHWKWTRPLHRTGNMRTIRRGGEYEIEIKKSRFLCAMERVDSEEAARAFINERRKEHWNATHNCTAYVLGEDGTVQRSSDDGEPGGTAGVPMLEVLRHRGLTDTVAVVTRYFGGTKLGAGGLIRAYGNAVSATVDELGVLERRHLLVVDVLADHALGGRLESDLRSSEVTVREVAYEDRVRIEVALPEEELTDFEVRLAELTGGRADLEARGTTVVEVVP